MEFHKLADIFPMMSTSEFAALKADIAKHGLREPIILAEGKIADGRNRYNACVELGIEPRYGKWDGVGSLVAFIVSMNLHRRHLSESQRAMVAAKVANMPQGARTDLQPSANLPEVSQPEAAQMLNVGERSIRSAKKVLIEGMPELAQAVEQGKVAVSLAASVAEWEDESQEEFVKEVKKGKKPASVAHSIQKRKATKEAQNAPDNIYNVILADPPWEYNNTIKKWGPAQLHYPTMSLDEICKLPEKIGLTIGDNAVLFLWTPNAILEEALKVVKAWGFHYKTNIAWVKDWDRGTGWYVRNRHELLLICTKGAFTPLDENIKPPIGSVITTKPGEHSEKPEEVYEIIESLYPDCSCMELFARNERESWEAWGNEA